MKEKYHINVNNMDIEAEYDLEKINEVFVPLFKKWTDMQKTLNRRIFIYVAAAPGVGKTTLTLFLQYLSQQNKEFEEIQAVGMDGFFCYPDYLTTHYLPGTDVKLSTIKGAPETYDVDYLIKKIKDAKENAVSLWPVYDRMAHHPVEDQMKIEKNIILLEGNYLLLNEEPWVKLKEFADDTIFIGSDPDWLKDRLVNRKMNSGYTAEFSNDFYLNVDRKNAVRINENSLPANTTLVLNDAGDYIQL